MALAADYPLRQEAAKVQIILDGALLCNENQPLSEETKAFVRNKIGAAAAGQGIRIISHFDTLEELMEAVPNPAAGDAYSIGTQLPYELFIYDHYSGDWRNYGPIRSNDIKARFAQNVSVPAGAWTEAAEAQEGFVFCASVALGEVSGNDFPIVAFGPSDAVSGNYSPICFAFDGYVEIWANTAPSADILLPAMTFIVQDSAEKITGNSTKGITNASGGIAPGGIGTSQLANNSVTKAKLSPSLSTLYIDCYVTAEWDGDAAPYTRQVQAEGLLATDRAVVRFSPPANFDALEDQQTAFALLYTADSTDGFITLYAKEKPEVDFGITLEVPRI